MMFRETLLMKFYTNRLLLLKVVAALLMFVWAIGLIMHSIEPEEFPMIFDGIWWAIVTISTVGYGDFVPESVFGRMIGISLILVGIAIFSFFVTNLATSTILIKEQNERGLGMYKKNNHLLVIGWNERSRLLLEETHELNPSQELVLIDETLQVLPKNYSFVRYIRGNPGQDETHLRANTKQAKTVVITANLHIEERQGDANTILTLITCKGINPELYAIVELVTEAQVTNAKRAGADEIIKASQHVSLLLMNGTLFHGITDVISKMLDHDQMDHLGLAQLSEELVGKTFEKAIETQEDKDQFLLGIRREGENTLHPPKHFILKRKDEIIYVKR
ncbi:potassium channel family protein [Salipaludibacillus sp. CF4.18]|uniref:potassium channel family protein n=1 Tax=Salipaludibacillus sp. CF4.18 TaxID=3373081 RepID=UPI003EE70E47